MEGPLNFHHAHLALCCGWLDSIQHRGHLSAVKQDSWIEGSPPGTPPRLPCHSTGCLVHSLVAAALGTISQELRPIPGADVRHTVHICPSRLLVKPPGTPEIQSPGHPSSEAPVLCPGPQAPLIWTVASLTAACLPQCGCWSGSPNPQLPSLAFSNPFSARSPRVFPGFSLQPHLPPSCLPPSPATENCLPFLPAVPADGDGPALIAAFLVNPLLRL